MRLVEGLPLAIELAAARVRMMGIGQIIERLRDRFKLLASGKAEGRHATLKAAIDSSWELLQPWERAAFAQRTRTRSRERIRWRSPRPRREGRRGRMRWVLWPCGSPPET